MHKSENKVIETIGKDKVESSSRMTSPKYIVKNTKTIYSSK